MVIRGQVDPYQVLIVHAGKTALLNNIFVSMQHASIQSPPCQEIDMDLSQLCECTTSIKAILSIVKFYVLLWQQETN